MLIALAGNVSYALQVFLSLASSLIVDNLLLSTTSGFKLVRSSWTVFQSSAVTCITSLINVNQI